MPHASPRPFHGRRSVHPIVGLCLVLLASGMAEAASRKAQPKAKPNPAIRRVQKLVDATRKSLTIPEVVTVELVETNPLKASVEPVKGAKVRTFKLSIEEAFLRQLSED